MRLLLSLLVFASLAHAEWHVTMADAKKAARRALKPILCVVLDGKNQDSIALERALSKDPLRSELGNFIGLRLDRSKSLPLVARYNLKRSPSTIIYSALGIPMKLIIGPTSVTEYTADLVEAAKRHERMVAPREGGKQTNEFGEIIFIHSGLCPRHCPTCTPTLTRSLQWLVGQQGRNGSWNSVEETALAGLALLAEGRSFPIETRKAKHVLMDGAGANGRARALVAIFLAEAYAREPDAELRTKLDSLAKEFKDPDAAGLAALCHLRAAGVRVEGIERAAAALQESGAESPAALYALMRSGVDRTKLEPAWAGFRRTFLDGSDLLFTALCMTARSVDAAHDFHVAFRDRLLGAQKENGSWKGSVVDTALASLVLQLPFGELKLAMRRPPRAQAKQSEKPKYLRLPHPTCRAKVFVRDDRYWVDLVISLDRPADGKYLAEIRAGIEGANRRLFDITDGQFSLHRVDVFPNRGQWDRADVLISKDFYDAQKNPLPWAHGITRLIGMKVNRGPEKGTLYRFGQWVMFPPEGVWWSDPRYQHVMAHELGHYLFGAPDEYSGGKSTCPCIQGIREYTELCTKSNHRDSRHPDACWILAKRNYPLLKIPAKPDPGPWDPPAPRVVVH
ncbi:MAG: hypothetical protein ACYS0F_00755 [Planctomycetota bacterium]|jgi:hypothetical protein